MSSEKWITLDTGKPFDFATYQKRGSTRKYWETRGKTYDKELMQFKTLEHQISVVEQLYNLTTKGRTVEIGCGTGRVLKNFKNAIGVDFSKSMLSRINSNSLILGDARILPILDKAFDISMAIEVLNHIRTDQISLVVAELERISNWIIVVYNKQELEKLKSSLFKNSSLIKELPTKGRFFPCEAQLWRVVA